MGKEIYENIERRPMSIREILLKLQEDTYKCNPNDIDTALALIKAELVKVVPQKRLPIEGEYEESNYLTAGYNQALSEILSALDKLFGESLTDRKG